MAKLLSKCKVSVFRSDRMAAITSLEVIQTADVTNDIVLQCSSCRAIVGDTRDYVCTIRINELLYIVLSGECIQGVLKHAQAC